MRTCTFIAAVLVLASGSIADAAPDPFFGCDWSDSKGDIVFRCLDVSGSFRIAAEADGRRALRKARDERRARSRKDGYESSTFVESSLTLGGRTYPAMRIDSIHHKAGGIRSQGIQVAMKSAGRLELVTCWGEDACPALLESVATRGLPEPAAALRRGKVAAVEIPRFGLETGAASFAGRVTVGGVKVTPEVDCSVHPGIHGGLSCSALDCGSPGGCTRPNLHWEFSRDERVPTTFTAWILQGKSRPGTGRPSVVRRTGRCRVAGKAAQCWQFTFAEESGASEIVGSVAVEPWGFLRVSCFIPGEPVIPPLCRQLLGELQLDPEEAPSGTP